MPAVRRVVDGELDRFLDVGIAITATGLATVAAWGVPGPIGQIHGPAWLRTLLPLLLGAPLLLRRRSPLLMWAAIWAGIALLTLVGGHPPQGLYLLFVLFCGAYALGAHAGFRDAVIGLVGTVPVIALISLVGVGVGLGTAPLGAFWLAGVLVRARRQQTALAARNAELERQADQARAAERTRIARELHDIVAHHLSVIVLQASGARASGAPAEAALEKIENSGRQALNETRRLLGVLREADPDTGFAPQPGIGDLDALATSVRATGLPVSLTVTGDHTAVSAAVDVSVYRIVQEALTNVLKHADATHADVAITCTSEAVTVEVTDNGAQHPPGPAPTGGHGLSGMRERVAIFGGELSTGTHPGGGFAVRVRLPLQDRRP